MPVLVPDRDQQIRLNSAADSAEPNESSTRLYASTVSGSGNIGVRRNDVRILHASGVDKFSYSGVLIVQDAPRITHRKSGPRVPRGMPCWV